MSEVINLNRVRKAKAKAAKAEQAAENRLKFGRTKSEKQKLAKERERVDQQIEGHRLNDSLDH